MVVNKFSIVESFIFTIYLFVVLPGAAIGLFASKGVDINTILLLIIVVGLVDISANVLNSYADWKIDVANRKRNNLHESFSKETLIYVYLIMIVILYFIILLIRSSIYLLTSVTIFVVIGIIYSVLFNFKDKSPHNYILIGLSYGALAFTIGFFLGSSSLSNYLKWVPFIIFLTIATIAHTITKDYADVKGDAKNKKLTFPVVYGKRTTIKIQTILMIIAYLFLAVLILFKVLDIWFVFGFVGFIFGMYIIYRVDKSTTEKELKTIALYNKMNHFLMRVVFIIILL